MWRGAEGRGGGGGGVDIDRNATTDFIIFLSILSLGLL